MPIRSFRTTSESEAALAQLGATKGNRTALINEAIVALAAWRQQAGEKQLDPAVLRDVTLIAGLQRDLDEVKRQLNGLARRRRAA